MSLSCRSGMMYLSVVIDPSTGDIIGASASRRLQLMGASYNLVTGAPKKIISPSPSGTDPEIQL